MKTFYSVLKSPIISEKSTAISETANVYSFKVAADVNKYEIKKAVENAFGVSVIAVRTSILPGKAKRTNRGVFKNVNWKKAFVTLKKDQKIELFKGV